MKSQNITRLMTRLNLILKVEDENVSKLYYLFIKSSKIWEDMNFISVRVDTLDDLSTPIKNHHNGIYTLEDTHKEDLSKKCQSIDELLSKEKCIKLAEKELDKVFGIKNFDGVLLKDFIDYIEESKTVNAITYYHHRFFALTKLDGLNRLIRLKTIELVPLELFIKLGRDTGNLHEKYNPSQVIRRFFSEETWKKDTLPALKIGHTNTKKKIGVLFSDLKGFGYIVKKFAATKESELTRLMIKKYQYLSSIEIKASGGYVVQTAGDAFMAIFTLTENVLDDIHRILQAAIGMLSINSVEIEGKPMELITRIGINIAEVEEGFLGALDLREYTVFGKGVNIASRLEKKVDELSESIDHFSGGILFNLTNCEIDTHANEQKIKELAGHINQIAHDIKNLSFKSRLKSFASELEHTYKIDLLFDKVNKNIKPLLAETFMQFVIEPELKRIQVKEGNTNCLFIYKKGSTTQ
ncbi:MAG: adenylate/guanylate cyclase domain-containing protein [Leptospiraceae bacterium]|nr:adenylate/guanylate cyclase domain-containing protein [Leptospiraceae bacterium]MCP5494810.1 adenylate/guanylate cyclase domain-containing protein [Leptospiraceae bacterium]